LTVNRTTYSFSRLLEVALPLVSDMETGEVEMQRPQNPIIHWGMWSSLGYLTSVVWSC